MLRVGITGGIGAGKTLVSEVFSALGIPVYYADKAASEIMERDPGLRAELIQLFGNDVYSENRLNRSYLSKEVFGNKEKLARLNALVHPAVIRAGKEWFEKQTTPYAIKEAALFFESGSNKDVDVMIGVSAPDDLRISRGMKRSNLSKADLEARIIEQMPQEEKMRLCDYVIINDDRSAVLPQVLALNKLLLKKGTASV